VAAREQTWEAWMASRTVDEYLAALPEEQRAVLRKLRKLRETIRAAAPAAEESISYGVPTFKYRKRPLIYFGAAKGHLAIYGMNGEAYREELEGYDRSKGTIRFSPGSPLPATLVEKMVKARMKEIEAGVVRGPKNAGRGRAAGNE
jgi:uncharacterized protein YdhG (YjbR/CyaY superfamily)